MIPKIIHYCWFGKTPKSPFIKQCMKTWKDKMPDYEWKEWNENTFDINSVSFVREAYKAKKWAFVSDYVRLYALYTEGGIYMDTDVKIMRPFDEFLKYNFFSSHEKYDFFHNADEQIKLDENHQLKPQYKFIEGFGVLSAVMGSIPKLSYLKDCLNYYDHLTFDLTSQHINDYVIGKHITYTITHYGYKFIDEIQHLRDNMVIFPSSVFVGNMQDLQPDSYAIHLCNGSWNGSDNFEYKIRNKFPKISPIIGIYKRIMNRALYIIKKI